MLPPGTVCVLGRTRVEATAVAALNRVVGDRDLAFTAAFQHAVLVNARAVDPTAMAPAGREGCESSTTSAAVGPPIWPALARAKATPTLARDVLGDELRRVEVEATLHTAAPTAAELQSWYSTYGESKARPDPDACTGLVARPPATGDRGAGRSHRDGCSRSPAGETTIVDGVKVTALGETTPLGAVPYATALPSIRVALVRELKQDAFAVWLRRRENRSLSAVACQHDQAPQPATVDLTDWLPYLSLG